MVLKLEIISMHSYLLLITCFESRMERKFNFFTLIYSNTYELMWIKVQLLMCFVGTCLSV
jgi:hypothetical protein